MREGPFRNRTESFSGIYYTQSLFEIHKFLLWLRSREQEIFSQRFLPFKWTQIASRQRKLSDDEINVDCLRHIFLDFHVLVFWSDDFAFLDCFPSLRSTLSVDGRIWRQFMLEPLSHACKCYALITRAAACFSINITVAAPQHEEAKANPRRGEFYFHKLLCRQTHWLRLNCYYERLFPEDFIIQCRFDKKLRCAEILNCAKTRLLYVEDEELMLVSVFLAFMCLRGMRKLANKLKNWRSNRRHEGEAMSHPGAQRKQQVWHASVYLSINTANKTLAWMNQFPEGDMRAAIISGTFSRKSPTWWIFTICLLSIFWWIVRRVLTTVITKALHEIFTAWLMIFSVETKK